MLCLWSARRRWRRAGHVCAAGRQRPNCRFVCLSGTGEEISNDGPGRAEASRGRAALCSPVTGWPPSGGERAGGGNGKRQKKREMGRHGQTSIENWRIQGAFRPRSPPLKDPKWSVSLPSPPQKKKRSIGRYSFL